MHIVTRRTDAAWTGFLLQKGASANARDREGNTPLMLATQVRWAEGVDIFVAIKAQLDLQNRIGETALLKAVQNRDLSIAKVLIEAGANPDITDSSGTSARSLAETDPRTVAIAKLMKDVPVRKARPAQGPDPVARSGFVAWAIGCDTPKGTIMERPSIAASAFDRPGVRVRTLSGLRWIAIGGQFTTVIFVGLYLGFPLLWPSLIAAITASAVLNIGLVTLYDRNARLSGRELALHLAFDLVQAGVLLFLTGGLANPFSVLLIVPVTIAATLLPAGAMALLGAVAVSILVVLHLWAKPLPLARPADRFRPCTSSASRQH